MMKSFDWLLNLVDLPQSAKPIKFCGIHKVNLAVWNGKQYAKSFCLIYNFIKFWEKKRGTGRVRRWNQIEKVFSFKLILELPKVCR